MQYVFTQYSGEYCPQLMHGGRNENREERMKCLESLTDIVYDKEVLAHGNSGQYMSIWQVFQASNVIQGPIQLAFPKGSENC